MRSDALSIHLSRVNDQLFAIAICTRCKIVRERIIANHSNARASAFLLSTEALSKAGCPHVEMYEFEMATVTDE